MKEKIIETSLQQFLKHGIRSITLQKLVLPLGISTKTVYKYFANKEELLEECLKAHYKDADKGLRDMLQGSANPVISLCTVYSKTAEMDFGTNQLFYQDLNYYYPELQDKVIKRYSSGAIDTLTDIIKQGIDNGYFLAYLHPAVALDALTVLYTSITRQDVFKKFGIKPADLIKQTIGVYIRGICTDKGLQVLNILRQPNY